MTNLLRTNYFFMLLYYIYNTSIIGPHRHVLKMSFRYTLGVMMKHEIGTLSSWKYINMSSKLSSKKM